MADHRITRAAAGLAVLLSIAGASRAPAADGVIEIN
jgi:hypothetical protein